MYATTGYVSVTMAPSRNEAEHLPGKQGLRVTSLGIGGPCSSPRTGGDSERKPYRCGWSFATPQVMTEGWPRNLDLSTLSRYGWSFGAPQHTRTRPRICSWLSAAHHGRIVCESCHCHQSLKTESIWWQRVASGRPFRVFAARGPAKAGRPRRQDTQVQGRALCCHREASLCRPGGCRWPSPFWGQVASCIDSSTKTDDPPVGLNRDTEGPPCSP